MQLNFDIKKKPKQENGLNQLFTETKDTSDVGVVLAKKNCHKGALIGHVSNGGGTVPLSENFSLRFVASEKFCEIELIATGGKPKYQNWQKVKKVKEDKVEKKTPKIEEQGQVEL